MSIFLQLRPAAGSLEELDVELAAYLVGSCQV